VQLKDFGESNPKIVKGVIQLFQAFLERKDHLEVVLPEFSLFLVRRSSDERFSQLLADLAEALGSQVGFSKLLSCCGNHISQVANQPRALADFYGLLGGVLGKTGEGFPGDDLKTLLLPGLNSPAVQARETAAELLKKIAPALPSVLSRNLLDAVVNPKFKQILKDELAKLPRPQSATDVPNTIRSHSTVSRSTSEERMRQRIPSRETKTSRPPLQSKSIQMPEPGLPKPDSPQALWDDIKINIIKHDTVIRTRYINKLFDLIDQNTDILASAISGDVYQSLRHRMGDESRAVTAQLFERLANSLERHFKTYRPVARRLIGDLLHLAAEKKVG
jgi:hypothetical protein